MDKLLEALKGVRKWIAILVLLVLFILAFVLSADDAEAETVLGVSGGMYNQGLQGFCAPALEMYMETETLWRFGAIAHEKDTNCLYKHYPILVEQNMGIYVAKVYPLWWFKFGLGAALWEHQDFAVGSTPCAFANGVTSCERGGSQLTFLLSAELDLRPISKRLPGEYFIAIRHFSTAGSSERNKGHDFAPMLGFRIRR